MKITFANPEMNVCHVVVGEHEGRALSSFITLNRGEIDFLHKYKTSSQSSAPTFHTFLRSREDDSCVTCLHVISVSKTNFTEIEAQELGGKIFAAASASIFPVPASSAQSREQPPLLIEPSFTQSSFSAVPVAPTIVPEEDQQMADVVLDFSTVWDPTIVANIALGFRIRSFSFTKYITKNNSAAKEFGQVFIMSSNNRITEQVYSDLVPIADAVDLARELSSEPPNVLSPEAMVKVARDLKRFGVKTEILEEKDMKKLGMEALLSVGQGSANESFMAICQWHGGHQDDAPIALVGKGVTFDSGGISIKPSNNMHEMKEDMTGAAVVLATLQMAAQLKLPVNLIGVVGLVENMP
ncbi:MAG: hypothetical protein LBF72_01015, partial [Holosporales bacterium]|nr:hypothetical protein [Holosporales bacterium]